MVPYSLPFAGTGGFIPGPTNIVRAIYAQIPGAQPLNDGSGAFEFPFPNPPLTEKGCKEAMDITIDFKPDLIVVYLRFAASRSAAVPNSTCNLRINVIIRRNWTHLTRRIATSRLSSEEETQYQCPDTQGHSNANANTDSKNFLEAGIEKNDILDAMDTATSNWFTLAAHFPSLISIMSRIPAPILKR
jgi:hypothetical protein